MTQMRRTPKFIAIGLPHSPAGPVPARPAGTLKDKL